MRAEGAPQASGAAAQPSPTWIRREMATAAVQGAPPRRPALCCSDWSYFQNKARTRRWGLGDVKPVCRNSEREHGAEGPGGGEGLWGPSVSALRSQGPPEFHLKHVPGVHGHASSKDAAPGPAPPQASQEPGPFSALDTHSVQLPGPLTWRVDRRAPADLRPSEVSCSLRPGQPLGALQSLDFASGSLSPGWKPRR